MPDTVTLVLDADQYHREMARVTAQNQRLSRSGDEIGRGFIRGDRAARVATANIVQGLATANSAADATLITLQSLERVFRIPLGLTIFAAGAIAAADAIGKIIEKEQKLRDDIHQLRLESRFGGDFLSSEDITKNLSDTSGKIKEITDDIVKLKSGKGKFLGIDFMGSETRKFFLSEDEKKLKELRAGAADDVSKLTEKQEKLNQVEQERLDHSEHQADLDKAEIDHNERLGKLNQQIAAAQLQGTDAAKKLLAAEDARYQIAKATLAVKQQEAQVKSLRTAGDFFSDLGSDRFVNNFFESQKRDIEIQRGQNRLQMAQEELARSRSRGEPDDPILKAMVATGERLGVNAQTGLNALIKADFSNLLMLSKYDFSGLAPLNHLTIQIQ